MESAFKFFGTAYSTLQVFFRRLPLDYSSFNNFVTTWAGAARLATGIAAVVALYLNLADRRKMSKPQLALVFDEQKSPLLLNTGESTVYDIVIKTHIQEVTAGKKHFGPNKLRRNPKNYFAYLGLLGSDTRVEDIKIGSHALSFITEMLHNKTLLTSDITDKQLPGIGQVELSAIVAVSCKPLFRSRIRTRIYKVVYEIEFEWNYDRSAIPHQLETKLVKTIITNSSTQRGFLHWKHSFTFPKKLGLNPKHRG